MFSCRWAWFCGKHWILKLQFSRLQWTQGLQSEAVHIYFRPPPAQGLLACWLEHQATGWEMPEIFPSEQLKVSSLRKLATNSNNTRHGISQRARDPMPPRRGRIWRSSIVPERTTQIFYCIVTKPTTMYYWSSVSHFLLSKLCGGLGIFHSHRCSARGVAL